MHASIEGDLNVVGAFALMVSDRVSDAIERQGGPGGSSGAALLLVHHGHVRRIDDLRAPLALTQASVVRLVDRLVDRRLLRRVAATEGDRRTVSLVLTSSGRARARALMRTRERVIGEILAGLKPGDLVTLGLVSGQVLAAVAREDRAPGRLCRYCDERACDLSRCPVEMAADETAGAS